MICIFQLELNKLLELKQLLMIKVSWKDVTFAFWQTSWHNNSRVSAMQPMQARYRVLSYILTP
jgi:hypothetical protein